MVGGRARSREARCEAEGVGARGHQDETLSASRVAGLGAGLVRTAHRLPTESKTARPSEKPEP